MAKLKNPLLSLKASGSLARVITFVRRGKVDLVEKKPELIDAHTSNQLAWRHMFNKCVDLWHTLNAEEKAEWESAARSRHMTGYAWYISQCLRPNPGIYLPLQGGTMSGDIDMDGNRLLKIPLPVYLDQPVRKGEFDALATKFNRGVRVYHSANQAIPINTWTALAMDSERWDTDNMHHPTVNNSHLTCTHAGKYLIIGGVQWAASGVGWRGLGIRLNGGIHIGLFIGGLSSLNISEGIVSCIGNLNPADYVQLEVYQNSGAPLNVLALMAHSTEFMMQRIGD